MPRIFDPFNPFNAPKFKVKNRTKMSQDPNVAFFEAIRQGKSRDEALRGLNINQIIQDESTEWDSLGIDEFQRKFKQKTPDKEFKPSFSELIEHSIDFINLWKVENQNLFSYRTGRKELELKNRFYHDYNERIKRVYTEDEIKSMAPKLTLVQIGMNLDHIQIPIKWLNQSFNTWRNSGPAKDSFFVLAYYEKRDQPFELFEFPTHNLIKPKSDYILFLDPYGPSETDIELTEVYLHIKGIKVIKKYDIKQAHELLIKRKNLFLSAPTATNTILLFQLMDAIILNEFKQGTLDLDAARERTLVRLEKLKNLASGTKFNEERKLAVENCFTQFDKLIVKVEEVKS